MILCINFNIKMKRTNNPTASRCMVDEMIGQKDGSFGGGNVVDKIAVSVELHVGDEGGKKVGGVSRAQL